MSERDSAGRVATWDGQARGWRRYTKEVAWFVASTPVNKRRYLASRLVSQLQGPARLLAMPWNRLSLIAMVAPCFCFESWQVHEPCRTQLRSCSSTLASRGDLENQWRTSWLGRLLAMKSLRKLFKDCGKSMEERNGIDQSELNCGLP